MVTLQLYLKPYFRSERGIERLLKLMIWMALIVGNSRFHWALFEANCLRQRWDTPHCSEPQLRELQGEGFANNVWQRLEIDHPENILDMAGAWPELWAASVVRSALQGLDTYPHLTVVERQQIPLGGLYETIGIDRALTLLGAGLVYGWPILVIDCGTALTFTAGDADKAGGSQGRFIGGAIAPGLGLQFRALHRDTDQLPYLDQQPLSLPERWARTTEDAITGGIIYTQIAGIRDFVMDWYRHHPHSKVMFTGGDGRKMAEYLKQYAPSFAKSIQVDPDLMFWGLRAYRQELTKGH